MTRTANLMYEVMPQVGPALEDTEPCAQGPTGPTEIGRAHV